VRESVCERERERERGRERERERERMTGEEEGRGEAGKGDENWKKVEEGRSDERDGQDTLRDQGGETTEVVVRNDNASTDISIIHTRGIPWHTSILGNCLVTRSSKNRLTLNAVFDVFTLCLPNKKGLPASFSRRE